MTAIRRMAAIPLSTTIDYNYHKELFMFIVESYAVAIIMCFITMICWGSWANTTKLVSNKNGSSSILLGLFNWIIAVFFVICLHAGFYGRSRSQFYT